jgi:Zn-finger nucleic acid-binding protein
MKQCPKCETGLSQKSAGSVEFDECEKCKGIWYGEDELRQAKDATDSDLNWLDFDIWKHQKEFTSKDSDLQCVACKVPMVSLEYGDSAVVIDYCPCCRGTWLDKGEFKRIIDSLEKEVVTKSFSDYVKEAIREGAEVVTGPESFLSEWKDFTTVLRLMQYRLFVEKPGLLSAVTGVQKTVQ